ncbi:MAG: DUF697 domain-containing protein [Desulfarculus sp.]|nr:DUF697 domain-containing protein [Desulfarculus sp.]
MARKPPPEPEPQAPPKVSRARRRVYQTPSEPQPLPETEPASSYPPAPEPVVLEGEVLEAATPMVGPKAEPGSMPREEIPHREEAERLIRRYAYWTAGVGLVPLPLLDMAALAGLQLAMLKDLAQLYQVGFSPWRARAIVTALAGGVIPVSAASGVLGTLARMVPIVGTAAGVLTLPALASGSTVALGKICALHFALGRDIFSLDPRQLARQVRQEMADPA